MNFCQKASDLFSSANQAQREVLEELAAIDNPTQQDVDKLNQINQEIALESRLSSAIESFRFQLKSKVFAYISNLQNAESDKPSLFTQNPVLDRIQTVEDFVDNQEDVRSLALALRKKSPDKMLKKILKAQEPTADDISLENLKIYTVSDFVKPQPIITVTSKPKVVVQPRASITSNTELETNTKPNIFKRHPISTAVLLTAFTYGTFLYNPATNSQSNNISDHQTIRMSKTPLDHSDLEADRINDPKPSFDTEMLMVAPDRVRMNFYFEGKNIASSISQFRDIARHNASLNIMKTHDADINTLHTDANKEITQSILSVYHRLRLQDRPLTINFFGVPGPLNVDSSYNKIGSVELPAAVAPTNPTQSVFTANIYGYVVEGKFLPFYFSEIIEKN